jgi:hypothetical protein
MATLTRLRVRSRLYRGRTISECDPLTDSQRIFPQLTADLRWVLLGVLACPLTEKLQDNQVLVRKFDSNQGAITFH